MTIYATVVGVRIWPRTSGSQRVVEFEWKDQPSSNDIEIHRTMSVVDQTSNFNLGDQVRITIEHKATIQ